MLKEAVRACTHSSMVECVLLKLLFYGYHGSDSKPQHHQIIHNREPSRKMSRCLNGDQDDIHLRMEKQIRCENESFVGLTQEPGTGWGSIEPQSEICASSRGPEGRPPLAKWAFKPEQDAFGFKTFSEIWNLPTHILWGLDFSDKGLSQGGKVPTIY